ncbi:unnamed protein product [Echinostoma caproni]|uniref:Uncharacterized protein n=1 Tax=Echinostoma caproni TaxID=27848 RepID=A0A3P8GK45_9TREM|nr:unnamed protein product [Echinostoma caproni]
MDVRLARAIFVLMLIQRSFLNWSRIFFGNEACAFRLLSAKTDGGESWIRSLMHRKEVEQQSHILSTSPCIYELQVHELKPHEHFLGLLPNTDSKAEIVGSWTCEIGHQDTAYHLWKYPGGYPCLGEHTEDIIEYKQKRNSMLCSRKNQVCLPFSYWPEPVPCRNGSNLYELRSYTLRLLVNHCIKLTVVKANAVPKFKLKLEKVWNELFNEKLIYLNDIL